MQPTIARRHRLHARVIVALAGTLTLAAALPAAAENFPDHPIRLIVPFGPGGPPDVAARIIGAYLSDHLGPVVVENLSLIHI